MNSKDLTRDQGLKVFLETREMLSRVYKIKERMDQLSIPPEDPVCAATETAWRAMIAMNQQWQAVSLGPSHGANLRPH